MMGLPAATGQGLQWCIAVIHNQALNSKRRYSRWSRESLALSQINENDMGFKDTIPSSQSLTDFSELEVILWIRTLPDTQYEIIRGLYVEGLTQKEMANRLKMSQQHVCRLKNRALQSLRRGWAE